jgi:hypothetical protein
MSEQTIAKELAGIVFHLHQHDITCMEAIRQLLKLMGIDDPPAMRADDL